MMEPTAIVFVLALAALTQLGGLIGGFLLIWKEHFAHRLAGLLLSFAAGTLLGVTFLDLLPETLREAAGPEDVLAYTLLGIVLFFVMEKLLLWRHHSHNEAEIIDDVMDIDGHLDAPALRSKHIRPLIVFGDGLHNFLDGAALALTFVVDWRLGLFTAVAIFLHEVPHNISDFAVLLHTRMARRSVLLANVLLALPSPIGAGLALFAVSRVESALAPLLAIAAGSFLYIALANLMPEIHHEQRRSRIIAQIVLFLLGIGVMWLVGRIFPE